MSVLTGIGPKFGYYPKQTKTWLVVKSYAPGKVESVFFGTKIKKTGEGSKYLGGLVGKRKFKDLLYITTKFNEWISQLELMIKIAAVEPRFACCAFIACFKHKVFLLFFSIWAFFHNYSRITGLQEKGEAISLTPNYHFHPLLRHLDISRAITAEISPLHIASSRTRTGNLWFRSGSR